MGYSDKHKRAGDLVMVSGIYVFDKFYADLKEMKPLSGTISANYAKNTGLSGYTLYHHDVTAKTLEMQYYIGGDTAEEAERNISGLLACLRECVIVTGITCFEYDCVLLSYTDTDTGVEHFHLITVKLAAVKRLPLVTVEMTESGTITNPGTTESGMILELVFNDPHDSIVVNGITLNNVPANVPFIIDGIHGEVTCDYESRLADTDLYKFPKMQPGSNEISLPDGCACKVSYYPTFM